MNTLKHIFLTLIQWVKQACLLHQTFAKATQQRRRQVILNEREDERLDRIRHPEKYRGK
jgi:hypothetical protein